VRRTALVHSGLRTGPNRWGPRRVPGLGPRRGAAAIAPVADAPAPTSEAATGAWTGAAADAPAAMSAMGISCFSIAGVFS
jgi:hypothetical protein